MAKRASPPELGGGTFGAAVRARRTALGLTQISLGEKMGRDQRIVTNIEVGTTKPNVFLAYEFAKALGVTLDELVADALAIQRPAAPRGGGTRSRSTSTKGADRDRDIRTLAKELDDSQVQLKAELERERAARKSLEVRLAEVEAVVVPLVVPKRGRR